MQAEAAAAALPPRAGGLVPQCPIQVPGATAVVAAEQRRRGDAGPQDTVFGTRFDDPGAGDGRLGIFGKRGSLGLLPVAGHVPAEIDAGPELAAGKVLGHFLRPVRDGGEVGPAAWIEAGIFNGLLLEAARRDLEGTSPFATQHEQSL